MKVIEPTVKYDIEITDEERMVLRKAKQILTELKNICLNKNIDLINFDDDEEQISFNEALFFDTLFLLDSVSSISSIEKEE